MNAKIIYLNVRSGQAIVGAQEIQRLDMEGKAAIHWAAAEGDIACFAQMVAVGADPESLTSDRDTAFDISVECNHFAIAEFILEAGSLQEPRPNGYNALDLPAMAGNLLGAEFLISHGAKINGHASIRPPIVWATQENQLSVFDLLLTHGASPFRYCSHPDFGDDMSALTLSAAEGKKEFIERILEVDMVFSEALLQQFRTARSLAIAYKHSDVTVMIEQAIS